MEIEKLNRQDGTSELVPLDLVRLARLLGLEGHEHLVLAQLKDGVELATVSFIYRKAE